MEVTQEAAGSHNKQQPRSISRGVSRGTRAEVAPHARSEPGQTAGQQKEQSDMNTTACTQGRDHRLPCCWPGKACAPVSGPFKMPGA